MDKHIALEPDFPAEKLAFETSAVELGMNLDKLPGGFYVDHSTQRAWWFWIRRAAIAVAGAQGVSQ